MLHRTQWSVLLIWKARFRVPPPPHPHAPIMYKGALTIPGFTFTNFVAGSEARLSVWVCSLYVGMHFISSMYAEVLGLRAAQFWRFFFLLVVGGQRAFVWQNIIDPRLGSNMSSISVCCIFPSSSNWVGEICCIWSVALDILLIYLICLVDFVAKSDDGTPFDFRTGSMIFGT